MDRTIIFQIGCIILTILLIIVIINQQPKDDTLIWECRMLIDVNKSLTTGDFNFKLDRMEIILPCKDYQIRNVLSNSEVV